MLGPALRPLPLVLLVACAAPVGPDLAAGTILGKADGAEGEPLSFAHADRGPLPFVAAVDPTMEVLGYDGLAKLHLRVTLSSCVKSLRGGSVEITSASEWSQTAQSRPLVESVVETVRALSFDELETVVVPAGDAWHRLVFQGLVEYDPSCVANEMDQLSRVVHQAVLIRRDGDVLTALPSVLGTGQRCVNHLLLTDVTDTTATVEAKVSGECRLAFQAGATVEAEVSSLDSTETDGTGVLTFDGEAFRGTLEGNALRAGTSLHVSMRSANDIARPVIETVLVPLDAGVANSLSVTGQFEACDSQPDGYAFFTFSADEREVGAISSLEVDVGDGWAVVDPGTIRDGRRWNRVFCGNSPAQIQIRVRTALGHDLETSISRVDNAELCGTFTSCMPAAVPGE